MSLAGRQPPQDPGSGLQEAARVFAERLAQSDPEPVAAFLARHEPLREWLEPMLAEAEAGDESVPETSPPQQGTRLGPYLLLRELGRGGMGVVYEARRSGEATPLALKLLPEHQALRGDAAARFAREAELAMRLSHPGIVHVRDTGAVDGTRFLVMDFVAGAPLDRVLDGLQQRDPAGLTGADLAAAVRVALLQPEGTPPLAEPLTEDAFRGGYVACVVRIAIQVAQALAHAHTAGVLHRDVKPSNLLLCPDGQVVLTDFGLAREAAASTLTLTGDFAGTPHYVSPEQAMAKRVPVDHRTDLFSLGSTLYELLTLRKAFAGDSAQEVLARILSKEPVAPGRLHRGLPDDLVTILLKLLEKDPDRRYQDATQLASDLRAFLEFRPVAARRASAIHRALRWTRREPVKAMLALVLLIAVPALTAAAGYLWARRDEIRAGRTQLRNERLEELVDQGFLGYQLENPDLGIPDFSAALELDHACTEAGLGLILASLRRDGPTAALARLEEPQLAAIAAPVRTLLRAALLQRLGRDAEFRQLEASVSAPRTCFELLLKGMLSRDQGLHAGTQLLEYTERAQLASERPRLWLHLHWAVFADQARDASSCRRCAANLLLNWPTAPVARYFACVALRGVDPVQAEALAREALATQPQVALLHCALGMVLRARQDLPAALSAFAQAVALSPATPTFHYNLGQTQYEAGDARKAAAEFRAALRLAPRMTDAWVALGMALRKLGEQADALDALRKAVAINPLHPDGHFQLGQLLMLMDQPEEGLAELREAARHVPKDANRWHHLASAQLVQRDADAAEQSLRKAVKAQPESDRAHELLARYLGDRGNAAGAREALEQWVTARPGSARAWTLFGWQGLEARLGADAAVDAVWAARRALALTREQSAEAWCLLGAGLDQLARPDDAWTAFARAAAAPATELTEAHRRLLQRHLAATSRPASAPADR